MKQEIGGYFEWEEYRGTEYYPDAIALNCGRNSIAYAVEARHYKKIYCPDFCDKAVEEGIERGGATWEKYQIGEDFRPIFNRILCDDEAILVINYYGQLRREELKNYRAKCKNIIVDNTQAFFAAPLEHVDTVYSCRKFFGVADGGYLFSDAKLRRNIETDISAGNMLFVLGRYDENASRYFGLSQANNERFKCSPIRYMSKLTHNILRSIDYEMAGKKRQDNAEYLHTQLKGINELEVHVPYGCFMYPFYPSGECGDALRAYLIAQGIFVPCLWPDVLSVESSKSVACRLAKNVVPLPCDHRYGMNEMKLIVHHVMEFIHTS